MNAPLLNSTELASIHQQVLAGKTRQTVATTYAPGQHLSHYRGQGVELEDNRPYHQGDDIRHMNWRATARSGKPTMKVFREERQRSLYLVIDKTQTMAFGTRNTLKANVAATAAAIFAFSAIAHHETIAGVVLNKKAKHYTPTRSLEQAFDFIHDIAGPLQTNNDPFWYRSDTGQLLAHLEQRTRQGCTIIFISDFIGLNEKHQQLIGKLAEKRQLIAIHVSDPAEESISNIGNIRLYSPITQQYHLIDTGNAEIRHNFNLQMQKRKQALTRFFNNYNMPIQQVSTQYDVFTQLEHHW